MNNFVAWSGGFDSTYLIVYLIERGLIPDKEINLVSFHHNLCNESKNIREKNSRELILKYLKDTYRTIKFNYIEINTQIYYSPNGSFNTDNSIGLSQPIIWLSQIIPVIPSNSNIYFGYLSNDDSAGFYRNMQEIINNASFIQNKHNINLYFPFCGKYSKPIIMDEFLYNYPALLDLCTSCENEIVNNDKCGKCGPCRHMKSALTELTINGDKRAKKLLDKWYGIEITITEKK